MVDETAPSNSPRESDGPTVTATRIGLESVRTVATTVFDDLSDRSHAIFRTIQTAIQHGAPLFNSLVESGRPPTGCAQIYLKAARIINAELDSSEDPGSRIVHGADLSKRLLAPIVTRNRDFPTTPSVDETTALPNSSDTTTIESLAWNLRHAFDAILLSPIRDIGLKSVRQVIRTAGSRRMDVVLLREVINEALACGYLLFDRQEFYGIATLHTETATLLTERAQRFGVSPECSSAISLLRKALAPHSVKTLDSAKTTAGDVFRCFQQILRELGPEAKLSKAIEPAAVSTASTDRQRSADRGREFDVFISYRSVERMTAEFLFAKLSDRFQVFLDGRNILPGTRFDDRILKVANETPVLLLLLTRGCLDKCDDESDWVRQELEAAIQSRSKIVPLHSADFEFPSKLPESIDDIRLTNSIGLTWMPPSRESWKRLPMVWMLSRKGRRQAKACAPKLAYLEQCRLSRGVVVGF